MKSTVSFAVRLALCAATVSPAQAADRLVPETYATIQAAINASSASDVVRVGPGIYRERITFGGRNISLVGTAGAASTVIDAQSAGTGVQIGPGGSISGFTIRNAADSFGAGMDVSGATSIITDNIFENNAQSSGGFGAAIAGNNASARIERNIFRGNSCDSQHLSAVITFVNSGTPQIFNNLFVDNPCRGVNVLNDGVVINNTFVRNRTGVYIRNTNQIFRNNVIVDNQVGIESTVSAIPNWQNNLVWGNDTDFTTLLNPTGQAGNISVDPLFRDAAAGDFRLTAGSPAIDAGTSALAPLDDLDGNPRPIDGTADGEALVDIGAYEFSGQAADDEASTATGVPVTIDVLANDGGFTNPVTVAIDGAPSHGMATVIGSPGNQTDIAIVYTPDAGFTGDDSFAYTVGDGNLQQTAAVRVAVGAFARADSGVAGPATPITIDVLANDVGLAAPVTITISTAPSTGGAVVTGSPGSPAAVRIIYTPASSFVGTDTFEYQVSDGAVTTRALVTVTVLAFQARPDSYVVLRDHCCNNLFVAVNDLGFRDPVALRSITQPLKGGTFFVASSNTTRNSVYFYYSPPNLTSDFTDHFTYEISDGTHTDTATVTLEVVAFRAQDDVATVPAGASKTIDVTDNDLGFDFPRVIGVFTNPLNGTTFVDGSGNIVYTPVAGFLGVDTFEYAIDDGSRIDTATVTVSVIEDADVDSITDDIDNCLLVANTGQQDADVDGFGNVCDGDLNNDGMVNFGDLALFRLKFATTDPLADFDGSGMVNFNDLAKFRLMFGKAPGPSALRP